MVAGFSGRADLAVIEDARRRQRRRRTGLSVLTLLLAAALAVLLLRTFRDPGGNTPTPAGSGSSSAPAASGRSTQRGATPVLNGYIVCLHGIGVPAVEFHVVRGVLEGVREHRGSYQRSIAGIRVRPGADGRPIITCLA